MAYQVLARKWRPGRFAELVGQEHVVSAISNALDNNRLHHAYLFTGTRGVGKTTIARIFSKSLNCEQGQSATPCGQCSTCVEIEQGNYVDLLEIDAASRTKVEDTRELLDNVQYKPTRGRFKVYLIDEVHMLSKHSFNALLKTLEEPPPHVKFLLATTDPQKLPITILSRCLQFNLKALSREQISQQLQHILKQESITFEDNALSLLAKAAQGSMRDALSLTDQAIAQGNNQVTASIVTDMLGLMDRQQLLKILFAITKRDAQEVLKQVDDIAMLAPDYATVLAELASLLHQIALTQWVPEACKLETNTAKAIYQLARHFAPEQVQVLYQTALQGRKDMPFASDGRSALEMTLLRMMTFVPVNPVGDRETLISQAPQGTASPASAASQMAEPETPAQIQPEATKASAPSEPEIPLGNDNYDDEAQHLQHEASGLMDEADDFRQQSEHAQYFDYGSGEYSEPQQYSEPPVDNQPPVEPQADLSPSPEPQQTAAPVSNTAAMLALRQKLKQQASEDKAETGKKSAEQKPEFVPPTSRAASSESHDEQIDASVQEQNIQPETAHSQPEQTADSNDDAPPPWVLENHDSSQNEDADPQSVSGVNINPEHSDPVSSTSGTNTTEKHHEPAPVNKLDVGLDEQGSHLPPYLDNGDKLTQAQQIDEWSALVEAMPIAGLLKQVALHSLYERKGSDIFLRLDPAQEHLVNETTASQLSTAMGEVLQSAVNVHVEFTKVDNSPFQIQQQINRMRERYARQVIQKDETIQSLVSAFNAEVVEDSIQPR